MSCRHDRPPGLPVRRSFVEGDELDHLHTVSDGIALGGAAGKSRSPQRQAEQSFVELRHRPGCGDQSDLNRGTSSSTAMARTLAARASFDAHRDEVENAAGPQRAVGRGPLIGRTLSPDCANRVSFARVGLWGGSVGAGAK